MYRYFQTSEKKTWYPLPDEKAEIVAREKGAKKLTILSVSELIDEDTTDKRNLRYKGPLYFDIDCEEDLGQAVSSCQRLVLKLKNLDVDEDDISVFCSGSKGLHVLVEQKVFSSGRAISQLPLIYKVLARELHVVGVDYQVYCQGRGNSWRLVNKRRDDGRFRVRITHEELQALTVGIYHQFVSKPRGVDTNKPPQKPAPGLQVLFEEARKEVGARVQRPQVIVTDSELKVVAEKEPPCVTLMADYTKISPDKSFNYVAWQVAIFLTRAGVASDKAHSIISRLAENASSSKYGSVKLREEHLFGQLAYMRGAESKFGCGGMRAALSVNPCADCPVKLQRGTDSVTESAEIGIVARGDGYYILGKTDRRITTFTLRPEATYIEKPQDGTAARRQGTLMEVLRGELVIGTIMFTEDSWISKAAFKREIAGLDNLAFLGSEDDVQRIKHRVYGEDQELSEITQVWTAGVHIEQVSKSQVMTYVEPGWSVNSNGIRGTHKLAGKLLCRPYLEEAKLPARENVKEVEQALLHLLQINQPLVVAQTLGWFAACHLKKHLFQLFHQFPLLNVWGNSGGGKSATTRLMGCLNGMDLGVRDQVPGCPGMTTYAAMEYGAGSTTIPRFYEEFNKSKIRPAVYSTLVEVFKSSWSEEASLRGTLGPKSSAGRTGATVSDIPASSPICFMSEQSVEVPALIERTVSVMMTKNNRQGRRRDFLDAEQSREQIRQVGKALMLSALRTSLTDARNLYIETEDMISEELDDRPRYGLQVCMIGLMFFKKVVMKELRCTEAVGQSIDTLIKSLQEHFSEISGEIEAFSSKTEVDMVMEDILLMIALSENGSENQRYLQGGLHYVVTDEHLFIQPIICHAAYKRYKSSVDRFLMPAIERYSQFQQLMKEEAYFIGMESPGGSSPPLAKLDLYQMGRRGFDISLVESAK